MKDVKRLGERSRAMSSVGPVAAAALTLLAAISVRGAAQAPATKTTLNGVYTAAQARRGEDTYSSICVSCHPYVTYTGVTFRSNWEGRTVFDLFDQVSQKMPKNEPGSLSPKEYADVIAFIFKLNKMPAGTTELPVDPAALRRIRIELKQ